MGLALVFLFCVVLALVGLILVLTNPNELFWKIVTKLVGGSILVGMGSVIYFLFTHMR